MASLMIDVITSLDGYGGAEGWPGLWGMDGPDYAAFRDEDAATDRTLLLGATTYRLFAGFAETGEENLAHLTAQPKIVFSRTLREPLGWANTTLVSTEATDAVRTLKQESRTDLRTLGSPSLCRSLLTAGLVDRYRVVVFPVVNGATGHDRMYDDWPDVALDLVEARTFDGRLQLLEYVPTVLAAPPAPPQPR